MEVADAEKAKVAATKVEIANKAVAKLAAVDAFVRTLDFHFFPSVCVSVCVCLCCLRQKKHAKLKCTQCTNMKERKAG